MIVKRYVKKSTIYIIAAVMAFLTAGALFFLIIFGLLGAIILFRYIFIPKEKRQKADAVSASLLTL